MINKIFEKLIKYRKDLIIFFAFWIIFGCLSLTIMHFPYYDWFNYHYYIGYAFVNDRYGIDFMPANYRSYFVPYLDAIQYYVLNLFNNHVKAFIFFENWDNALAMLLLYKISNYIFKNNQKLKDYVAGWTLLYIIYAPIVILMLEFSMTDVKIACIILTAFYILIKKLFEKNNLKYIFISGLLLGCAAALKLTAFTYCITVFLAILFLRKRISSPFKTLGIYCLGVIFSFSVIALPWYYKIYTHFDNPLFPYFNNIFHSSFTNNTPLIDKDFAHLKPRNLLELIIFPIMTSMNHKFGTDEFVFDPRYTIAFIAILIILPTLIKNRKNEYYLNIIKTNHLLLIIYFSIISYYINTAIFGTYRYIFSTYLTLALLVFIALYYICKTFTYKKFVFFSILLILCVSINTKIEKSNIFKDLPNNKIVSVKDMKIEDDSYVLIANFGSSFVIPYQNKNAHYIIAPMKLPPQKNLPWYLFDIVFSAKNLASNYTNSRLSNILTSNKKVYLIIIKIDLKSKNLFEEGLDYYSNNTRNIQNCQDMNVKIYGIKYNPIILCEYNKI